MFYCSFYFTCSLIWTASGTWLRDSIPMLWSGFVSANLPWRFAGRSLGIYLQGNRRVVWRLERPLAKCAVCKVPTTEILLHLPRMNTWMCWCFGIDWLDVLPSVITRSIKRQNGIVLALLTHCEEVRDVKTTVQLPVASHFLRRCNKSGFFTHGPELAAQGEWAATPILEDYLRGWTDQ